MPNARSLHIGVNSVDPEQYDGWSGDLLACEFDAHDMAALAAGCGIGSSTLLLTRDATSGNVLGALHEAADALEAGDLLVLTYSGHGGQAPDTDGDEQDAVDETWVLYDRQVLDDELYAAYARFAPGVRIAVLSDSCHSGTVTRMIAPMPVGAGLPSGALAVAPPPGPPSAAAGGAPRSRAMPPARAQRDYLGRREVYEAAKREAGPAREADIGACVTLISGCQDNQLSLDGTFNGLFTATLLTVWNGGKFRGGYQRLRDQVARRMPETQTPHFSVVGTHDAEFVRSQPFTPHAA